jgi:hypothetical protein
MQVSTGRSARSSSSNSREAGTRPRARRPRRCCRPTRRRRGWRQRWPGAASPWLFVGVMAHSTQVVSQGRHHHSRSTDEVQPWASGLKAPAGSPQKKHRDPWPSWASIHPVALEVAACMPSSLGVVFVMDRGSRGDGRLSSRPASVVASGLLQTASTRWLQRAGSRSAAAPLGGGLRPPVWLGPWREQRGLALGVVGALPELPAICQQRSLTTPQASSCRLDAIRILSRIDVRERMGAC